MSIAEQLADYPVVEELPVVWGEMDAFQHVNNTVYFRYFETARLALFMKIGFEEHMKKTGEGPILASTSCRFKRPLTYPDKVSVGTRVINIEKDRFTMLYRVVSHRLEALAADGEGLIVCFNYKSSTKCGLPDPIRARIEAL